MRNNDKIVIVFLALMVLICGFCMADSGIDPVPETQGITTATTLDLVGNMASSTDIQWRITDNYFGLDDPDMVLLLWAFPYYTSTYSEDTYSNGIGLIAYDKNMDLETSHQLSGQWNIDADKQIEFVGVDGARIYSDENIIVDGVGGILVTRDEMLCPFAYPRGILTSDYPPFCNYAETGSTVDMTVANIRTTSSDRFITPSADTSVELEHDILVTDLGEGLPSSGTASAYMDVLIQEGRLTAEDFPAGGRLIHLSFSERIEFSEASSVHGDINIFDKEMNYESMRTGQGV